VKVKTRRTGQVRRAMARVGAAAELTKPTGGGGLRLWE